MKSFKIDNENNITIFASAAEAEAGAGESFVSEADWQGLTAAWPTARLVDIWNSIPGLTPVKRFTDRKTATARIWKAIQSLGRGVGTPAAQVASDRSVSRKKAGSVKKGTHPGKRGTPAKKAFKTSQVRNGQVRTREGSKTAQVLRMLNQPRGATLKELMTYASHCTSLG